MIGWRATNNIASAKQDRWFEVRQRIPVVLGVLAMFLLSFSLVSASARASTMVDNSVAINGPIYIVGNTEVESIDLSKLEYINGPIYIVNNANLNSVHFPKLTFVNGPVYLTYNPALNETQFTADLFVNGPIYDDMNGNGVICYSAFRSETEPSPFLFAGRRRTAKSLLTKPHC